ncbi:hypothetical protein ACJJTC_006963 [Scirpophaga incertulas]
MIFVSQLILLGVDFILVTPLYPDRHHNAVSLLRRSLARPEKPQILDYKKEKKKSELTTDDEESTEEISNNISDVGIKKNAARRARRAKKNFSKSSLESSSLEMTQWKDSWKELWIKKKFEAINSSNPQGDTVNMLEARPWGVPCGDPQQHDMPWGNCMLPMQCDAEYRIYRGDYNCGRTQFVCCALQIHNYDMYQGFDVSFADSELTTDSEEKRDRNKGSQGKSRNKKFKARQKRRRERMKRKRKMKQEIKKIVREMQRILNRSFKNATTQRKRKTKQLKKFIAMLKKDYKKDRFSVQDIHADAMKNIDAAFQTKLEQLRVMNNEFMKNSTFRDILVNGTISSKVARELLQVYPELSTILLARRSNNNHDDKNDYLNYDIEYGLLYY